LNSKPPRALMFFLIKKAQDAGSTSKLSSCAFNLATAFLSCSMI